MDGIYTQLCNAISTILAGVTNVKQVVEYPTAIFEKYPAVVFFPSETSNVFSTTADNFREYKFKMFIAIGVDQSTMSHVFKKVMPNTCDAILAAFDSNWTLSTIDNHRVWCRIDAGTWNVEKTEKGLMAVSEWDIIIKMSVNN